MADNGVLWSVRYYGQTDGQVKKILAKEIDRLLDQFEEGGKDWTSADLADGLVTDMDMKPSGAAGIAITPERIRKIKALIPDQLFEQDSYEDVIRRVLKADQEARKR